MNWVVLDQYFPYIVFLYGFLALVVLETPFVANLRKQSPRFSASLSAGLRQLETRKTFAYTCFYVGAFWSLQNLLFS